jgi:hypothetical protein
MESSSILPGHPHDSEAQLIADLRLLAKALQAVADPFKDGFSALGEARQLALRISRFYDVGLSSSSVPSKQFLVVGQLFRRLTNDTWKLLAGDSAIHIGRGIENNPGCRDAFVDVLRRLGAFLQLALSSEDGSVSGKAIYEYSEAMAAHYRMAIACEAFLISGHPK